MRTLQDFNVHLQEAFLDNGVQVVLYRRPAAPIHIRALFFSGSRFDTPGKEGLSHFTEHMVVAGSKRFPSKDGLASFIEATGGQFSAFTSAETLVVNVEIAGSDELGSAITVLQAMLSEATFTSKVVENERGSILKEIGDRESDPRMYLWELWSPLVYGLSDMGHSVLGSRESVRRITRDDLWDFYKTMLVANRMVYVVSGDIEMEKLVAGLSNVSIPSGASLLLPDVPVNREVKFAYKHYTGDQVHLMLSFRTASHYHEDAVALGVLASIIGGGRASVLARKLRYEKGLVYGVQAAQYGRSNSGVWFIKTSTSKENLQELLDVVCAELERIQRGGITSDELQFTQSRLINSRRRDMQTSEAWVNSHEAFSGLLMSQSYRTLVDWMQAVRNVTLEDLARVGARYFVPDSWYLAMCGEVSPNEVVISF